MALKFELVTISPQVIDEIVYFKVKKDLDVMLACVDGNYKDGNPVIGIKDVWWKSEKLGENPSTAIFFFLITLVSLCRATNSTRDDESAVRNMMLIPCTVVCVYGTKVFWEFREFSDFVSHILSPIWTVCEVYEEMLESMLPSSEF